MDQVSVMKARASTARQLLTNMSLSYRPAGSYEVRDGKTDGASIDRSDVATTA